MSSPLPVAVLLDFFLQDFQLSENVQFWNGHGWMTVLIVAWLAPRAVVPRRILGWLTVFCLVRQLVVAREYLYSSLANSPFDLIEPTAHLSRLLGIVCAWLLWELTARLRAADGAPITAGHWLARAGWAALLATGIATGVDGAGVIETLVIAPTTVLLALAFWRHGPAEEAPGMRLVGVGFGVFGLATAGSTLAGAFESGALELLLHLIGTGGWFVVAGLGWAVFRHYRTFSRVACAFYFILLLYPVWVGLTFLTLIPPTTERTRQNLLDWAEQQTATVPVATVARLVGNQPAATDRAAVEAELRGIITSSAFTRRVYVWVPENGRRRIVAGLGPGRPWLIRADRPTYWDDVPQRPEFTAGGRFLSPPYEAHDGELIRLTRPLRTTPDGPVVAWLTVESNSRPYWRSLTSTFVVLVVFFDCFAPYLNAVAILSWRRATEQRRIEQLIRVQQADRAKTEFLAFLGHELRTPLQTILGRAELLGAAPASAHHAAAIDAQGRLLLRLVNDLLDLGTIEAGHFVLHPQPFSLRTALRHTEDLVRPLATAKGLAFHLHVDPAVPEGLLGDEARLRQILGNLLANAVKYTPAGTVTLHVSSDANSPVAQLSTLNSQPGERLTFAVRDTGPGLPEEKIPQLFTLFTRLDEGDSFTREGTGVGLALVRRLCDLMGGQVTAGNRLGGGAEFTVTLAFPRAVAPTPVAVLPPPAAAPCVVLVVEDNTAAREVLAEALRGLGHTVSTASDGPAALAACTRTRFDAVVLDINLPGVDGIEIARRLRALPDCPRLVGCSAEAFDHVRAAALAAGMDAFLAKPVSLAELSRTLGAPLPAAPAADIFARLDSPATLARARATLRAEWPALRAATATAVAGGDPTALRRLGHYLHTSALLLKDPELIDLCARLSDPAAQPSTVLAAVDSHLRPASDAV